MKRYFSQFRLAEVQRTFYKPPAPETLRRWRSSAGDEFEFTLKAWQLITHPPGPTYRRAKIEVEEEKRHKYGFFRPTEEVYSALEVTLEAARELRASALVFQCPPSFRQSPENIDNLRQFFSSLSRRMLLALELRAPWDRELLKELLEELSLVHCVDPLREEPLTSGTAYFRLHGRYEGRRIIYSHTYSREELESVLEQALRHSQAYVLFNNLSMSQDARRFEQLLMERLSA
ncbi:MAG: DUF72 domain-containing protein [Euryarchaeota archaeon]|nr:DUF72 domain-containing protein [Euryarchaeota archaeon]